MKIYGTILFTFFAFFAFAQPPTGDIQKDTTLANKLFYRASSAINTNTVTKRTIQQLEQASDLYEAHPFNQNLIAVKQKLAIAYYKAFKIDKAAEVAFSTIDIVENEGFKNHCILNETYYILSEIYIRRDIEMAKEYGFKALECVDKTSLNYFIGSYTLVELLSYSNQYAAIDSIIFNLENILDKQIEYNKDAFQLYIYRSKVLYHSASQNKEQAILYLQKLFDINKKAKILDNDELSVLYVRMGQLYTEIKAYETALEWTKRGKTISSIPENHPLYGNFYSHIGTVYMNSTEYDLAIKNFQKAIDYSLRDSLNYKIQLALSNYKMALCYYNRGDYSDARKCIKASARYTYHPNSSILLSRIYEKEGKYSKSLEAAHKAVLGISTRFKSTDVTQNPSLYEPLKDPVTGAKLLMLKGKSWHSWGVATNDITKIKSAIELFEQSLIIEDQNWKITLGFDKARAKLSYDKVSLLNMLLESEQFIFAKNPTDAQFEKLLNISEKKKAIQLIETLSPSFLPKKLYKQEQVLVKKVQKARRELDLVQYQKNQDSIQLCKDVLFEVSEELQAYFKNIKINYPKESNHFYNNEYANLKDIQKGLSDKTLFVGYSAFNQKSAASKTRNGLIITISQSNKNIVKADFSNLKDMLNKLNELIQDRFAFQKPVRDEFIDVSHELYKTLIEPIEAELEGKTKLMIVVEGQLFHLPFELLLKSNEKKPYHELDFLIKKYEINYHYSATAFFKIKEKKTIKDKSLLAFAPVFSKGDKLTTATRSLDFMVDSVYRSIENFEFVALPNTKKEVKAISKLVEANNGTVSILLSKNATKDKLSQQLESQSYQFIHIATHGLVNFKNPKLSALACYS
ncbi:MAG: CHAT domain-containing protein, partial [Saprospiraceae bacterium]